MFEPEPALQKTRAPEFSRTDLGARRVPKSKSGFRAVPSRNDPSRGYEPNGNRSHTCVRVKICGKNPTSDRPPDVGGHEAPGRWG
jgi:hypothetical protein